MSCTHFGTMNIGPHAFFKVEIFMVFSNSMWPLPIAHYSGEVCEHTYWSSKFSFLFLNIYKDQILETMI
jgi:hypothetical protein